MDISEHPQLFIEIKDAPRPRQKLEEIGLEDACFIDALAQFDLYGVWRIDLESGMVFWSRDVFEIHGLPYKEGPIDQTKALNAYHPDDRALVRDCFADAIERKTGFRFVMRIMGADSEYHLIKASGMYRVNRHGKGEVYGTFSLFQERVRTVAVNS
ncbi:MAG: PAS domain-containing protein [Oricola sp.]